MRPARILCGLLAAAIVAFGTAGAQEVTYVSIGTGQATGVYYPVGREVCRILNEASPDQGIHCGPEATPGSIYNLQKLRERELDFAIVQSDNQFEAYRGLGAFAGRPATWLRSVAALHPELVAVLVRQDSGIETLDDLKRKRINAGVRGSGSRSTWDAFEAAARWSPEERGTITELKPDVAQTALCAGRIDASLLLVGHPSGAVARQLAACPTKLVPLRGPQVDTVVQGAPQFRPGAIPASAYRLEADVPSFGVRATLVTTASMSDDLVYRLTKALLDDLDQLRKAHPALAALTASTMAKEGLTAPLHPGAARAYREAGAMAN
ncbi:MAG: TAXI family TRAP transporter solute-binding subunit [Alsobacter sp.]